MRQCESAYLSKANKKNILNKFIVASIIGVISLNGFASVNSIRMKISGNGSWDEAGIRFNPGATPAFDGMYDAWKLMSPNLNVPQIFTKVSTCEMLCINSYPELDCKRTFDLFSRISTPGAYNFSAVEIDQFDPAVCIYLEDMLDGQLYNLRTTNSYSFNLASSDENSPARFRVHFSYPANLVLFNATCAQSIDGAAIIRKAGDNAWSYQLYNSTGNLISSKVSVNETDTVFFLGTDNYTVNITTTYGCSESYTFYIGEYAPVAAGFTTADSIFYLSQSEIQFTDVSLNPGYYNWNFGDGSPIDFSQNPIHKFTAAGDYTVTQTVFNGSCYDSLTKVIHVIPELTTEVIENNLNNLVNVYYNGSEIILETNFSKIADMKFLVMNSIGQVVVNSEINNAKPGRHAVNINGNTEGYYTVMIAVNETIAAKKVAIIGQ